jgi:hypothetical protein
VRTSEGKWIGLEKAGNASSNREPVCDRPAKQRQSRHCLMERALLYTAPEFSQARQAIRCVVAGNQACVDCSYGGTDHPVRLNTGFVQRLVNADLVGSQSTAALQHQNDLADVRRQHDTARTRLVDYHFARTGL